VCLFPRKDCGEERKTRERSIFSSLELSRKPMERKNLMDPHMEIFPRQYGEKG